MFKNLFKKGGDASGQQKASPKQPEFRARPASAPRPSDIRRGTAGPAGKGVQPGRTAGQPGRTEPAQKEITPEAAAKMAKLLSYYMKEEEK